MIHTCKKCKTEYDTEEQIGEGEGSGIYWCPSCPTCNNDIGGPELSETDIEAALWTYRTLEDCPDSILEKAHLWARELHGRRVDL